MNPGPTPITKASVPGGKSESLALMRSRLIRDIRAAHHFRIGDGNSLWVWSQGTWTEVEEDWTWNQCALAIGGGWLSQGHITSQLVSTVHGNLKTSQPLLQIKPPSLKINLLNGIWDARTGTLGPTGPALWPSPVLIPISWDPKALCPAWDLFLAQILEPDLIEYFWELIGACLVSDVFIQKMVWLAGEGGNGKGTLLLAISSFAGTRNVASLSLTDLLTDRFAPAQLYGRLLCMDPDSSLRDIQDPNLLKKMTGTDELTVQEKYKKGFKIQPFCKTIVAANGLPSSPDISKGFLGKFLIIPMVANFRDQAGERNQAQILTELAGEHPGALNKALAGLARLVQRGKFAIPARIEAASSEFREGGNPLQEFAHTYLQKDPQEEILEADLRTAYNSWALQFGHRPVKHAVMVEWVSRHFGVSLVRKGTAGPRPRCFPGLRLLC